MCVECVDCKGSVAVLILIRGNSLQQVKDFVRKAKEWRNGVWPKDRDTAGRPKSYLLGLLVAYAYEESGAEGTRDAAARSLCLNPKANFLWLRCLVFKSKTIQLSSHFANQMLAQ